MIAKITKNKSFTTLVNYVLDERKDPKIIMSTGVRNYDKKFIIDDFNFIRNLHKKVLKPALHISLSFAHEDRLSEKQIQDAVRLYVKYMELKDRQTMVVRHNDTKHDHVHLVINRIDDQGRLLKDSFERYQSKKVTKRIEKEMNLTVAEGRKNQSKDQIMSVVDEWSKDPSGGIEALEKMLRKSDWILSFQEQKTTKDPKHKTRKGWSFKHAENGTIFKGSELIPNKLRGAKTTLVDRHYTYTRFILSKSLKPLVDHHIKEVNSFQELNDRLKKHSFQVLPVTNINRSTNKQQIVGLRFASTLDPGIWMNGSDIHRSLSYSKLQMQMSRNKGRGKSPENPSMER